jgi:thiamine-phosphate pyrophosphorylase
VPLAYYITDRKNCPVPLLQNIQLAIEAGIDFIQIREKDLTARELLSLTTRAQEMTMGCETKIIINDRLDVALASNLNGIHVGQSSIPAAEIRAKVLLEDFIIGISTHSLEEAQEAQRTGANYITFGPIHSTPSKVIFGRPVGLQALGEVCQFSTIPVLALGGIDRHNYRESLFHGAAGIAAIRLFQDSSCSLKKIVREIKEFQATI